MKCKLNDLCFIVGADIDKCNLGKIVTCVEYLGYLGKGAYLYNNLYYYTTDSLDHYWLIKGSTITQDDQILGYNVVGEISLLPIKGEPIEDSEISSKELEFN